MDMVIRRPAAGQITVLPRIFLRSATGKSASWAGMERNLGLRMAHAKDDYADRIRQVFAALNDPTLSLIGLIPFHRNRVSKNSPGWRSTIGSCVNLYPPKIRVATDLGPLTFELQIDVAFDRRQPRIWVQSASQRNTAGAQTTRFYQLAQQIGDRLTEATRQFYWDHLNPTLLENGCQPTEDAFQPEGKVRVLADRTPSQPDCENQHRKLDAMIGLLPTRPRAQWRRVTFSDYWGDEDKPSLLACAFGKKETLFLATQEGPPSELVNFHLKRVAHTPAFN